MSSYNCEKELPSCFISKELLDEVEAYVLKCASEINQNDNKIDINYKFKINDSAGSESFNSSKDYGRATLPNDIRSVVFDLTHWKGRLSKLEVRLGTNKYSTKISISSEGDAAKETAIGIIDEIHRRLSQHKNLNFLFYGKLGAVPYGLFGVAVGMVFQTSDKKSPEFLLLAAFLFICSIAFGALCYALKWSSPYCEFDTPRNREISKWRLWLLTGAIGAALFGVIPRILWS